MKTTQKERDVCLYSSTSKERQIIKQHFMNQNLEFSCWECTEKVRIVGGSPGVLKILGQKFHYSKMNKHGHFLLFQGSRVALCFVTCNFRKSQLLQQLDSKGHYLYKNLCCLCAFFWPPVYFFFITNYFCPPTTTAL